MTREEVVAKARDLVTPIIGASTTQKFIDTVFSIERVKNVVALRAMIARA
jgi:hypothetical protein